MERNEIESLRQVANSRILQILSLLDVKCSERYNYINGACPVHLGDNRSAFSFHVDMGRWRCFTNNCDKEFGGDIFGLIRGIKKCDFMASVYTLRELLNVEPGFTLSNDILANSDFIKRTREEEKIYDVGCLNKLTYHNYLEERGYPRELIESYHIGVSKNQWKPMANRIIFPIRNINSEIVGFSGRTIYANYKGLGIPKWYHSKGFRKDENLFNIDRAAKYIEETGVAIVTEGPLDVLRFEQAGIHNSIALMGIDIHNKQIGMLIQCGATKLMIALDNDNAGNTGTLNIIQQTKNFFLSERIEIPSIYKDIGEMPVDDIRLLLNEKVVV